MSWNQTGPELKGWVRDCHDIFGDNKQQAVFILQEGDTNQPFFLKAASSTVHKCLRGKKEESLSGPVKRGKQSLLTQSQWQILPLLGKGKASSRV